MFEEGIDHHEPNGKGGVDMTNRTQTLIESMDEFMEQSRNLGPEYAGPWLEDCNDYGELTKAAAGHPISDIPEYIWDELSRKEFVEDFGGVPDKGAFLEGFNNKLDDLRDRACGILLDLQQS